MSGELTGKANHRVKQPGTWFQIQGEAHRKKRFVRRSSSRTNSVEIHQRLMKPSGKQPLPLRRPTLVEQRVQTLILTAAYDSNITVSCPSIHHPFQWPCSRDVLDLAGYLATFHYPDPDRCSLRCQTFTRPQPVEGMSLNIIGCFPGLQAF